MAMCGGARFAAQVFRDVDDLQSLDELEEYVRQSGVVLLFVSKGYFASRNCLRELRAAVQVRPSAGVRAGSRARVTVGHPPPRCARGGAGGQAAGRRARGRPVQG